jgi:hypothetical protein
VAGLSASSGTEDDQPGSDGQAFNYSIYLMLGVPYVLLGTVGFFVYRGLKETQRRNETPAEKPAESP